MGGGGESDTGDLVYILLVEGGGSWELGWQTGRVMGEVRKEREGVGGEPGG